MMRAALILAALPALAHAGAWNPCRPSQISHAPALASAAKVCVNEVGAHASWQCLQSGKWVDYRAVVRWDYATTAMRADFDAWTKASKDPADLRALEAKHHTGNADTDPRLLAVRNAGGYCWTPPEVPR